MEVIRSLSHKPSWISEIANAVEAWRRSQGWSRETVCQAIVEAHERIGGPESTGIRFDSPSPDIVQRQKNNADRIYRWLDDVSKDNNLLTANFIPSILAALPADRVVRLVNRLLLGNSLGAHPLAVDDSENTFGVIGQSIKQAGAHTSALVDLMDGIDPGELEAAHAALTANIERATQARRKIESKLAAGR